MPADDKDIHAQEFTDIERQTLRVWFDLDSAGNDTLADAVLNAGLQLEHYTSLLADDPGMRTPGQLAHQQLLAFRLSEQLSLAEAFLKTHTAGRQGGLAEMQHQLDELTARVDALAGWRKELTK